MLVIGEEASIHLSEQLRDGTQINLSGVDAHVSHVGRKAGQQRIDISAFAIPLEESVDCKGMPQVMGARTIATRFWNVALLDEPSKVGVRGLCAEPVVPRGDDEVGD